MKIHNKTAVFAALTISIISSQAGDYKTPVVEGHVETHDSNLWDPHRPDSHAPIGVMGDHTHEQGEIMASYRWMYMKMDGHRAGTNSLSSNQVFHMGYSTAAVEMDMHMHMFGIMYGVNDWFTLASMINYVEQDMHLLSAPSSGHGHGGHGAHGHGHGHGGSSRHGHSSQGLGDITIGGLFKIYDDNNQRVHLNLGLNLPTAEVDKKQHGSFLPYGMQLGSGTWDLKPGITYLGQTDHFSWGLQAMGAIRLEDENESGYALGDLVNITPWFAVPLSDSISVSARLNYTYQEDIDGHYNGPHNHSAPPHFQENYGGHYLDAGVGMNLYFRKGIFAGHRLAAEVLLPLAQDLNGVGMERDYAFTIGWQKAW